MMLHDTVRDVLDNGIPAALTTCSKDGEPNCAYLSVVQYVDETHLALSFQFFNTTIRNILENPHAYMMLTDMMGTTQWGLRLRFQSEVTDGEIFEDMAMRLDAIASMQGMSDVFKLRGVHIYEVLDVEHFVW